MKAPRKQTYNSVSGTVYAVYDVYRNPTPAEDINGNVIHPEHATIGDFCDLYHPDSPKGEWEMLYVQTADQLKEDVYGVLRDYL